MPTAIERRLDHQHAFPLDRHFAFDPRLLEPSQIKGRLPAGRDHFGQRGGPDLLLKVGKRYWRKPKLLSFALVRQNHSAQEDFRLFGGGQRPKYFLRHIPGKCQAEREKQFVAKQIGLTVAAYPFILRYALKRHGIIRKKVFLASEKRQGGVPHQAERPTRV